MTLSDRAIRSTFGPLKALHFGYRIAPARSSLAQDATPEATMKQIFLSVSFATCSVLLSVVVCAANPTDGATANAGAEASVNPAPLAPTGSAVTRSDAEKSPSTGAPTGSAGPSQASAETELSRQRQSISEKIGNLEAVESELAESSAEGATDLADELDLLRSLDSILAQHQTLLQQRAELEGEKKRAQEALDHVRNFGLDEPKPYSFLLLEDIRDQVEAETAREKATQNDRRAAEGLLEQTRDDFDEHEQDRRLAQEELDQNDDPDQTSRLAREVRLAELQSAISREKVATRKLEIEVKSIRLEVCELRQKVLHEKLERVEKTAAFSERDLKSRLQDVAKQVSELKRRLRESELRLQRLDAEQASASHDVDDSADGRLVRNEIAESYRLARRCHHDEITLWNQRLSELDRIKHFWDCRYQTINGKAEASDLKDWQESAAAFLEQMQEAEQSLSLRLNEIRLDQATLYRRMHEGSDSQGNLFRWQEFQANQLRRLGDSCESSAVQLSAAQRSLQRFVDDLNSRLEPEEKVDLFGPLRIVLENAWNYELTSVDDRPITIGKVVTLICYFVIGLLVARIIARLIAGRVLPRFGLNDGAVHAVQSILFYSLSTIFTLLSLELAHLPFAAFTFLGGAAAIGIGFGSQNILNNFISGLILLTEQPIRVGDLVEIDHIQGTVEHIGPRSTCVRTASNHEIIVPNSKLLENKVVNLTLSDNLVQTGIGVSMATVIELQDARCLLKHCAASHSKVLANPEPVVLFKEFNANSMSFELHFWLRLNNTMECRLVESEVREKIHELFRNATATTIPMGPEADEKLTRRPRLAG